MNTYYCSTLLAVCVLLSACTPSVSAVEAAKPSPTLPAAPLAGEWQIDEASGTTIHNVKAYVRFNQQEQRFQAYAGCNRMFGTYQQHNHELTMGAVASTLMMCEAPYMANDRVIGQALENTAQYRIQAQQLELLDKQGKVVLKAHR